MIVLNNSYKCERIGAIPAPPPTYNISESDSLIKNSPKGPEIVTLSPGFFEKIYEEAIPGLTSIQEFLDLSHGGVAILTFNMISVPSAG